jgi:hypothetical protein
MARRLSFLACLGRLEQWLGAQQIPYAVFGSVAAAAWTGQGASLDFDRPGARDPAERIRPRPAPPPTWQHRTAAG